jgi:uncharacterized membrane protein
MHKREPDVIAQTLLGRAYTELDERTQKVARHVASRTHIARNVATEAPGKTTAAQRAADAVARFGGSWVFVGLFALAILGWITVNVVLLAINGHSFDPFPFTLLNLFLSMVAAIQAPIILMSQNRQAGKDRLAAEHDYEVNLKAELEIMLLHDKLDALRDKQWNELLRIQAQQLDLLRALGPSERPAAR